MSLLFFTSRMKRRRMTTSLVVALTLLLLLMLPISNKCQAFQQSQPFLRYRNISKRSSPSSSKAATSASALILHATNSGSSHSPSFLGGEEDYERLRADFEATWHLYVPPATTAAAASGNKRRDTASSVSLSSASLSSITKNDSRKIILHHKKTQVHLLETLLDHDHAIETLQLSWTCTPCGCRYDLEQMPVSALVHLAQKHPDWCEPHSVLASRYYQNGNLLQAYEHALLVLDVCPYHFQIHSLLVKLALCRKDVGMALSWARMRLPSLQQRKRRRRWVRRAVSQAREQYVEARYEYEVAQRKRGGWKQKESEDFESVSVPLQVTAKSWQ